MYSTQDPESLQNLKFWIEKLQQKLSSKINTVLIGNKLSEQEAKILDKEIEQFIYEHNLRHFEVNIQEDFEIDMPFLELAAAMSGLGNLSGMDIDDESNLNIDTELKLSRTKNSLECVL